MAHPASDDREKLQIDVFLNEYQACHRNKDHFDSVRWTIGSIFVGASLTLFGISFGKQVVEVLLASIFSFLLMIFWYLYFQHVNPFVMASIVRIHEIEKALRDRKLEIRLHKSIHDTEKEIIHAKGTTITFLLISSMVGMWLFRIALLTYDSFTFVCLLEAFVGFLIGFWWVHFRMFNAINWGERIRDTSNVE
jgi:hypothetical protein